jgi:hypothetical protein
VCPLTEPKPHYRASAILIRVLEEAVAEFRDLIKFGLLNLLLVYLR